jgi:hypothetical protein
MWGEMLDSGQRRAITIVSFLFYLAHLLSDQLPFVPGALNCDGLITVSERAFVVCPSAAVPV